MRLPLLDVHPIASAPRMLTTQYISDTLKQPLFTLSEVTDVIDMPYGVEMTINDGFYVTVLSYIVIRAMLRTAVALLREHSKR
jgi:hypothetical protein